MFETSSRREILLALMLPGILAISWLLLSPGLSGVFMFDDFHNLSPLGEGGGVRDLPSLLRFVFGGEAGPLGRPISLASFVVDAQDWPADPYPFKRHNLLLHLLCGIGVFVLIRQLAEVGGLNGERALLAAALACAIWLLHPMQQATFFPVVQRMTQLSTLFMLAGMTAWLRGRVELLAGMPVRGYLWMSGAVVLGTAFAALSKENGVLLPALILVVSLTVARIPDSTSGWRGWRAAFLWLPTIAIVVYLLYVGSRYDGDFPGRSYGPIERMLTQPLILLSYLHELLLPSIRSSPYSDIWQAVSLSEISWQSAAAVVFLIMALAVATALRRRHPWLSLAVLGFLVCHLIESGPLSLELSFTHRNYLAIIFPIAAISVACLAARPALRTYAAVAVVGFVCVAAGVATLSSRGWGDPAMLYSGWSREQPASLRAQTSAAAYWLSAGNPWGAQDFVKQGLLHHPDSPALAFQRYWVDCALERDATRSFDQLFTTARIGPRENFVFPAITDMSKMVERSDCIGMDRYQLIALTEQFFANPNYADKRAQGLLGWRLFQMHMTVGRPREAERYLRASLKDSDAELLHLSLADALLLQGRYEAAADALDRARERSPYTGIGNLIFRDDRRREKLERLAMELRGSGITGVKGNSNVTQ